MQYSALRVAPIFCGMLATALRMPAAPSVIDLNSLLTNNPFVGTQAVGAKINAQPIELRGIMAERGVYWFNLYDPATKKSVWVCKGETIDEYDKIREPRRVTGVRTLQATSDLIVRIQRQGPRVITHDFVDPKRPTWHDPVYLRNAFMEVCERCHLPLK